MSFFHVLNSAFSSSRVNPFPKTAQANDALRINSYFEAPESIVFSLPTLPANTVAELDISMLDMNQPNPNLDQFI